MANVKYQQTNSLHRRTSGFNNQVHRFSLLLCAAFFTVYFSVGCSQNTGHPSVLTRDYRVMGGIILEIKLYGTPEELQPMFQKIYEKVKVVDDTCNIYNPDSELARLNTSAYREPFNCGPLLWKLLLISKKYYELTGGAFDVTAGPLMKLWGFHSKLKQLPPEEKIKEVERHIGLDKVIFDMKNHTVRFTVPGMKLDLGGIAKGFAVQQAAEFALSEGVKRGIINLSGNAYCFPEPFPGRKTYVIGIRNPLDKNTVCGKTGMLNLSVATSGDYERYVVINGRHYGHIMNPATGKPVENILSVTVVTPSGTDADALSTSVFVKGAKFAEKYSSAHSDTSFLIIRMGKEGRSETVRFGAHKFQLDQSALDKSSDNNSASVKK